MASKVKVEKKYTFSGHKDCVYTLEPADQPSVFFSGAGDGMVVRWDLSDPDNGDLIAKLPTSVYALKFLLERKMLIIGQNYQGLHIVNYEDKKEIASIKITDNAIFDIDVYDKYCIVACGKGEIVIVDLALLRIIKRLNVTSQNARAITINHERKEAAIGFSDYKIRIIDLENFEIKHTFEAHNNSVFTLQYGPDKKTLISAGRDARIRSWLIDGNYLKMEDIPAHLYAINNMVFHPNHQWFATCSMDKSIKLWDTRTMKLLKVIDKARHAGHGTSVNKLYWSAYQNWLVSCSDDRTISVWELDMSALQA